MNFTPKMTVKTRVVADCPSHSRAGITVRDMAFLIDEPVERGGTNAGPSPTETAIAALAGRTNVVGNKCAKALGVERGQPTTIAVRELDRRGVTLAEADGASSAEELAQVAEEVAIFCLHSKLFKAAVTERERIQGKCARFPARNARQRRGWSRAADGSSSNRLEETWRKAA